MTTIEAKSDEEIDAQIDDELGQSDDDAFLAKPHPGRPQKLTPEVEADIIMALNAGNFIVVAVEYAGIDKSTFYKWCERGRRSPKSKYGKFLEKVRKAIRTNEVRNVAIVSRAAEGGNVQAAQWLLTKKNYKRWGDKSKLQVEDTADKLVTVRYVNDWKKNDVIEKSDAEAAKDP